MVRKAADLYGLPLEEFTKARDELAKELRGAGKKEAADEVKALRKPSVSAWTVNQLARRHPQETKALVKPATSFARRSEPPSEAAGPKRFGDASRAHRDRLDELTTAARDELGAAGATLQRVAQTLRGASVDKEASKALIAGTLSGDVEQSGFRAAAGGRATVGLPPAGKAEGRRRRSRSRTWKAAKRKQLQEKLEKERARLRELEAQLDELD